MIYYNNKNYKLLNIDSKKPSDKFKELWAEVDIRDYTFVERL